MRVITGTARGTKLISRDGLDTRPTTDKVKEALFSIIQFYIPDAKVLDLFSGSGALGIEALSRGAKWCDFVDFSRSAVAVIEKNIEKTHLADKSAVTTSDFKSFLKSHTTPYDVIFLDPPYKHGLCDEAGKYIAEGGLLSDGGIVVCEVSDEETPTLPFTLIKEAKYGKTKIFIFKRDDSN